MADMQKYDVAVIGGGAAGLSAALMLGRSRRSAIVIDAGQPRNAPASGVHGLLGLEGINPAELLARGRSQAEAYGAVITSGQVTDVTGRSGDFRLTLTDGRSISARRVLVATGLIDELPDVEGLAQRWGREVLHCPYCHGWEVRDQAIGVLATGPMSMHQTLLFRQLSDDVVYFSHRSTPPADDDAQKLAARGIRVIDGEVTGVEVTDDRLSGVRLSDGSVVHRQALVVATTMIARADFLAGVGLKAIDHPSGVGEQIPADATTGRTTVDGIWVAGNVTDLSAQVGASAAAAAMAAAHINADLVMSETDEAVAHLQATA